MSGSIQELPPLFAGSLRLDTRLCCLQITKEFGMSMYRLEETIVDMAVSLIQLGIATPKLKAGY